MYRSIKGITQSINNVQEETFLLKIKESSALIGTLLSLPCHHCLGAVFILLVGANSVSAYVNTRHTFTFAKLSSHTSPLYHSFPLYHHISYVP